MASKILLWLCLLHVAVALLQIDCIAQGLKGLECVRWITSYLAAFTGNCGITYSCDPKVLSPPVSVSQGYFPLQAPQDDVTFEYSYFTGVEVNVTSLKVTFELDIYNIIGIDDLSGTISYSGNFVFTWYDKNLAWNESLTPLPIDLSLLIPSSWVWTPDVKVLDHISDDTSGNSKLAIYSSGYMFYSPLFKSTAACMLELKNFPFDTQTCTVEYLSAIEWVGTGIRFDKPTIYIGPRVNPISWQVRDTSITKEERVFHGNGNKSVVIVTFTLRRYTSFYWVTAIIPCILIVLVATGSLWLKEYTTRLSIDVTAMLTVVAIVWSISPTIPLCNQIVWIESFCRTSILIITLICLQSTLSSVISTRTDRISASEKMLFNSLVILNSRIIDIASCAFLRRMSAKEQSSASSRFSIKDAEMRGASPDSRKMLPIGVDQEKGVDDDDDASEGLNAYDDIRVTDDDEADISLRLQSRASSDFSIKDADKRGASPDSRKMLPIGVDQEKGEDDDDDDASEGLNAYAAIRVTDDDEADILLQIRREWRQYASQFDFTCKLITVVALVAVYITYFK